MIRRLLERVRRRGRTLIPGTESVSGQTVKSGVWVMLLNVSNRLLQLGMVVFVASLIGPAEFGLMGIALLVLSGFSRLTSLGLNSSLIQHEDSNVDRYLNTAWTIRLLREVLLLGGILLTAPLIAGLLGEPQATPVIRALGVSRLVGEFANPGVMYFQKELDFHKQFAYSLSSRLVYVGVAVGYALATPTVWALVFGHLAGSVTKTIVSYLVHGYRPWPAFDREYAREMLTYGKWIFGSSILTFLVNEGDDVFVGWALGAASLGLYQMAYRISNAPATEITHIISRVVFPTYAKLQDEPETLRRGYLDTVKLITVVSLPMGIGILLVLPSFTRAFLGGEWTSMILPAQILAVFGLLRSFRSAAVPLFRAAGAPDYDTKIRLLKLAVIAVLIYPASQTYGLTGVALVIVANAVVANPVTHTLALDLVDGEWSEFLPLFAYPAVGAATMGLCVLAIQRVLTGGPAVAEFVATILVGVVSYAAAMLLVERWSGYDLTALVHTIRSSLA